MPPRFSGGTRLASNPAPKLTATEARSALIGMIDKATRPILDAYPPAERLSWDAKEQEAKAVLAVAEPEPADYPLLSGELSAELSIAVGDVSSADIAIKAASVMAKAAAWRATSSALAGIRRRGEAAIAAATDDAGRRAAVKTARAGVTAAGL